MSASIDILWSIFSALTVFISFRKRKKRK